MRPSAHSTTGRLMTLALSCISAWRWHRPAPPPARRIQLAPGRALAVEQLFPAHGLHPARQAVGGNALLLEVVELVGNALLTQPGAGLS
jgi:hypothetical protein